MDASFLIQEGPTSHAHVGGTAILAGPAPGITELREHIAGRLDLMGRYRHRLAHTALDGARPVWVDDVRFDLDYHVRHTALPAPGDRQQFESAVASAYSQPLDRSRPLWEIWMVEGLENGAFALIFKVHHAMVDGSAAVDLLKILCDLTPSAAPAEGSLERWRPQATPGHLSLVVGGVRGAAGREIVELYPIALLQPKHALAIAVTSYNGQLNFGVLGDYDTLPDIGVVSEGIEAGLAELVGRSRRASVVRAPFGRRSQARRPEPVRV